MSEDHASVRLFSTIPPDSPLGRMVRESLLRLRDQADPETRELISEVLAGKRGIRELTDTGWFASRLEEKTMSPDFFSGLMCSAETARAQGIDPEAVVAETDGGGHGS